MLATGCQELGKCGSGTARKDLCCLEIFWKVSGGVWRLSEDACLSVWVGVREGVWTLEVVWEVSLGLSGVVV